MKVRSTAVKYPLTKTAASAAAAAGLSRVVANSTERLVQLGGDILETSAPPLQGPGTHLVQKMVELPGLGLAAGALTGVGIASGAIWGQEKVELQDAPWHKKLLLNAPVQLFNQGIEFRQDVQSARQQGDFQTAFGLGAKAGARVGANIGRNAGRVQGGISGGLLGWQVSGQVHDAIQSFLNPLVQSGPLPPILQRFLPLAVSLSCVVAGQTLGSAAGGAVGSVLGSGLGGVSAGLYAGIRRLD